ncbi:ABC transporter ATP-binding protein [Methylophaga lonarensis]|uniref:ABC transporter ATP-binding protein n=1 Tax=Methylophaga lonarensis TaxID=999151 RepID=UPI003D2B910C
MTKLLEANNLGKRFGQQTAVSDINIHLSRGEVLGFLGPNGAGKSTTMKMLSGNLAPTNGQILINGVDLLEQPKQAKAHIGYLPETPPLYRELTVREFLVFCGRLNLLAGKPLRIAVDRVIERCGLGDVQHRLIGQLSKGFQQRVGIAQAIVHHPAVVILDEPTSGLDPIQIRDIRHLIREVANEHSVILSTHILPEVQMLCDRVQIIAHGQLLFSDSIDALSKQMHASSLQVQLANAPSVSELSAIAGVVSLQTIADSTFRLHYQPDNDPTERLVSLAVANGWQLRQLVAEQHSLEDVFMKIVQREENSKDA